MPTFVEDVLSNISTQFSWILQQFEFLKIERYGDYVIWRYTRVKQIPLKYLV